MRLLCLLCNGGRDYWRAYDRAFTRTLPRARVGGDRGFMSVIWAAVAAAAAAATTTTIAAVPGGMLKLHKRREGWRSLRRAQQSDKEFLFQ